MGQKLIRLDFDCQYKKIGYRDGMQTAITFLLC